MHRRPSGTEPFSTRRDPWLFVRSRDSSCPDDREWPKYLARPRPRFKVRDGSPIVSKPVANPADRVFELRRLQSSEDAPPEIPPAENLLHRVDDRQRRLARLLMATTLNPAVPSGTVRIASIAASNCLFRSKAPPSIRRKEGAIRIGLESGSEEFRSRPRLCSRRNKDLPAPRRRGHCSVGFDGELEILDRLVGSAGADVNRRP